MTTLRRFTCDDLFTFNNVNLDYFTETVCLASMYTKYGKRRDQSWILKHLCSSQYNLPFYLQYLANWPEYCLIAEGAGQQAMGYILGKVEGQGESWHGHVTALTVAPDFRCSTSPSHPSHLLMHSVWILLQQGHAADLQEVHGTQY